MSCRLMHDRTLVIWRLYRHSMEQSSRYVYLDGRSHEQRLRTDQWARRVELFKVENDTLDLSSVPDTRLKEAWHEWARKEEMKRYMTI